MKTVCKYEHMVISERVTVLILYMQRCTMDTALTDDA